MRKYHLVLVNGSERDVMAEKVFVDGTGALIFANGKDVLVAYNRDTWTYVEVERLDDQSVEPIRVSSQGSWVQKLGGKSERTKTLRSTTPMGFARAFFATNSWAHEHAVDDAAMTA